jgi:hypothetical protein
MRFPAALNHRPVGLVSVHRDLHAPAAGSDSAIEAVVVQLCKHVFKLFNVIKRTCRGDIAPVKQNMHTRLFYAAFLRLAQHLEKMIYVRMDIAVR